MVSGDKYFFEYYVPTINGRQSPKQASKNFTTQFQAVSEAQRRLREGKIVQANLFVISGRSVRYLTSIK